MLADVIHKKTRAISTTEESIRQRGNKVYIDAGQNDYADTLAAPYSVRPYHRPLVSTPLEWKELTAKLDRNAFTIHTIAKRLKKKKDIFRNIFSPVITRSNNHALAALLS